MEPATIKIAFIVLAAGVGQCLWWVRKVSNDLSDLKSSYVSRKELANNLDRMLEKQEDTQEAVHEIKVELAKLAERMKIE